MAQSLGALLRAGWRPLRSIILGSWDGEEPGLIGSTAWAEAMGGGVLRRALVYVNVDEAMNCNSAKPCGDQLRLLGSPALAPALLAALRQVTDPRSGRPLAPPKQVSCALYIRW